MPPASTRPITVEPTGTRPDSAAWVGSVNGQQPDPFAVNPIRRSAVLVAAGAACLFGPLMFAGPDAGAAVILGGWLGLFGLAVGIPVLALSLIEEGWRRVLRRLRPTVDQLDLPPRLVHALHRHGYHAIAAVERATDEELLLLANVDRRNVRDVRRAISLWRYRRWQEQGFP